MALYPVDIPLLSQPHTSQALTPTFPGMFQLQNYLEERWDKKSDRTLFEKQLFKVLEEECGSRVSRHRINSEYHFPKIRIYPTPPPSLC